METELANYHITLLLHTKTITVNEAWKRYLSPIQDQYSRFHTAQIEFFYEKLNNFYTLFK